MEVNKNKTGASGHELRSGSKAATKRRESDETADGGRKLSDKFQKVLDLDRGGTDRPPEGGKSGKDRGRCSSVGDGQEKFKPNTSGTDQPKAGRRHGRVNKKRNIDKKPHDRATDLFLVMSDDVSNHKNLKDYLMYRMGNPKGIEFEVKNIIKRKEKMVSRDLVVLTLPSNKKASAARSLLHRGNYGSESKITCHFDELEAKGLLEEKERKYSDLREKTIRGIIEAARKELELHDKRISDAQEHVNETERELAVKRGLTLDRYEKLKNENLAWGDKLKELKNQRLEFENYLMSLKEKIKAIVHNPKFENNMKEIRRSFGIECGKLNAALPMYARREDILSMIQNNQVCVVLGETGSGKSTQIAQYLYQAGFAGDGMIACTQPRKIAAVSLATHVSAELLTNVGKVVGYRVGMQRKCTSLTKVLFMTDHVLLNECLQDGNLSNYSCVIIDEAHERSIYTDLLIGMLKKCMDKRPELRVIITSATIDPEVFVKYFGGEHFCPVLKVSGRTFPVDVIWDTANGNETAFPENYESKAVKKAIEVHRAHRIDEGDILVFLATPLETERCTERFIASMSSDDFVCLQLHGRLKIDEQQKVFEKAPTGKRKIVFATNSAETSITIPGICFVIDTGVAKEMRYDPKKNMNSLDTMPVSQSSANQRKGRAGRTASGICHRLYLKKDFEKMEKSGCPEILRVHLSQALLKLMELGVDPLNFEFVQTPKHGAMEAAMKSLNEIGAVQERSITDLGKWIAKLPVEPRLGVLVRNGIDAGVPIESLVIAACSSQSGIFYRGSSIEEKNQSDKQKQKFCQKSGDLLTALDVYRKWDKIEERKKGQWCNQNCINGKSMKGVRETVKEVMTVLNSELKQKLKYELKESTEEVDDILQKLILGVMKSNLCFYLGHESAGYLIIDRDQQVQIHPSSALKSLGIQPTWVIFSQLLKTSADFITNVTPVKQGLIDNLLAKKEIQIDVNHLESRKVVMATRHPVGKHVFWKFVGPMHIRRRELENLIQETCNNTIIVIDANKPLGEVSLYCLPEYREVASEMVRREINDLSKQLKSETLEEMIGTNLSGVRALLQDGGKVKSILMPSQYRTLKLKPNSHLKGEPTEQDVQELFSSFGEVEQVWKHKTANAKQNDWGKVTFANEADAVTAVEIIKTVHDFDFLVEPLTFSSRSSTDGDFILKLKLCRRKSKGHCYVILDMPEDLAKLMMTTVYVCSNRVELQIPKKDGKSDLFVKGLPTDVEEEQVCDGLADALGISLADNPGRFKIIIPRENVISKTDEKQVIQNELSRLVSSHVMRSTFRLFVLDFKNQTAFVCAKVSFKDPNECEKAGKGITESHDTVYGNRVKVSQEFKTSVHIRQDVFRVVENEINAFLMRRRQLQSSTLVQLRPLKSGHYSLDITAGSPRKLAKLKVLVDDIIDGEEITSDSAGNLSVFFSRYGKQVLETTRQETKTIIYLDQTEMKLIVKGLKENRAKALEKLREFIDTCGTIAEKTISLKGHEYPPGMLKALLSNFEHDLEKLQSQFKLFAVTLNFRRHELTLAGNEESLKDALESIEVLRSVENQKGSRIDTDADTPDCPVCLCPVDKDNYRLESCGHAYCQTCLDSQVKNAISSKSFPVTCASEGCDTPFVIRDFTSFVKRGVVKKPTWIDAAISNFVSQNSQEYKYCLTPDCNMVYRVSSTGEPFTCSLCQTKICTSCNIEYHMGMTCAMYKSAKEDNNSLKKWLNEKPNSRKQCPKCAVGIEKIEGCNHMSCKCGAHICWVCLKHFSSGSECYGHLNSVHQSFI